jgi:hypothetical protein
MKESVKKSKKKSEKAKEQNYHESIRRTEKTEWELKAKSRVEHDAHSMFTRAPDAST